ncbi:MAG: hypothetical protein R3C10_05425 [Pirellulales bacterium]|nr:hypothetical protein [Planctomycetales bacterium]
MLRTFRRLAAQDEGVLTFEWILLITLVVIGIVGALSAVRDATISELGGVAGAVVSIDQSYSIAPDPCIGGNGFNYVDPSDQVNTCRPDEPPVTKSSGGGLQ